jgi:peptidoglycan/LPS O-acetylase OafA/YrhL
MYSAARSNAIDFVKGILVVAMVGYHTLNYFVIGKPLAYCYFFYVGPAFIFFSGFMCGTVYLEKFKEDKKYVFRRLLVRSLKLVLLFFGLNILIHSMFRENYSGQRLGINLILDNLGSVFLKGNPALMAFEILVPISYTLLISIPILCLAKLKYFMYVLLISIIGALSLLHKGLPYNIHYGLYGVTGVYTGLVITELKSRLKSRFIGFAVALILFLYLFVLIPGRVNVEGSLILFFIYVNIVIAASYLLGSYLESRGVLPRVFIKFGRYSLYLYLAQIFILQVLSRLGISMEEFEPLRTFIIFASVSISLIPVSYLTDYVRGRILIADRIYRFIFA